MSFHVGQKVVCIDKWPRGSIRDYWDRFWHPYKSPIKGGIYTVSGVYTDPENQPHIELAELPNRDDFWMDGFYACGFRPITDISVFTAMLKTKKLSPSERIKALALETPLTKEPTDAQA